MGIDFTVEVVYGIKVRGQDVPWDLVEDDNILPSPESDEIRVITNGGYTDVCKQNCVIGYYLKSVSEYSDIDILSITSDNSYLDDALEACAEKYGFKGKPKLYLVPNWS